MKRLGNIHWMALALGTLAVVSDVVAEDPPPRWKTGNSFQRALATRFEAVDWPQGSAVRDRLQRLSQWQQVAVFLDREIDPGAHVKLAGRKISLAEVFDQVAGQVGASTATIGSVVYMAPRNKAAVLSRVALQRSLETRDAIGSARASRMTAKTLAWPELSEPRDLLTQLTSEVGASIVGIEQIPHDLWPQVNLPPLSWSDRMTIMLAGFGKTFRWTSNGKSIELVPLPSASLVKRSYEATLSQLNYEQLTKQFPEAQLTRSSEGLVLYGTTDEHERLKKLLNRQSTGNRTPGPKPKTVHSMRVVQQPAGAILKTIERQLQVRFEFGDGVMEKLYTRVSFDLHDVPLDKLLQEALTPANLSYLRNGKVIRVTVKD